ncbi:MAG: LolA family protein [Holosporales bacterium]
MQKIFMRSLFTIFGFGLVLSLPCAAQQGPTTIEWTQKIQHALQNLVTAKAQFVQTNPDGSQHSGTLYLNRPGRLRMQYDNPKGQLVIADGTWIIFHNPNMDDTTYLGLNETPAGLLLKDRIDFSKGVAVIDMQETANDITLSFVDVNAQEIGTLSLIFNKATLDLKGWIVEDSQRQKTRVMFEGLQKGQKLDPKLFIFERPRF